MFVALLRKINQTLAGGEDYGYFASNAGDAGSNPAAGIVPAWSKRKDA